MSWDNYKQKQKGTNLCTTDWKGKVNKAIKILEKANKGGILSLSDETFEIL